CSCPRRSGPPRPTPRRPGSRARRRPAPPQPLCQGALARRTACRPPGTRSRSSPGHASCHAARALMQLLIPPSRHRQPPASRGPVRDAFVRVLRFIEQRVRGFYTAVAVSILLPLLVGIAAVVLFLLIGESVMAGATRDLDTAVLLWAARNRTPALTGAMLEITALGSTLVLGIVVGTAAVFLWLTGHRLSVYILGLALAAAAVLNLVLKALYDRPRPEMVATVIAPQSSAFPSGHALSSFAVYGTIAYLVARLEPSP